MILPSLFATTKEIVEQNCPLEILCVRVSKNLFCRPFADELFPGLRIRICMDPHYTVYGSWIRIRINGEKLDPNMDPH